MLRKASLLVAFLALASASPAQAVLITVSFGTNSFTFDSSLIPTGGGVVGDISSNVDLANSISFAIGPHTWNSSNAGVNYLRFDGSGNLLEFFMGGDASGIGNSVIDLPSELDFRWYSTLGDYAFQFDDGTTAQQGGGSGPTAMFTVSPQPPYPASVPEPAPWMLLSAGLAGIAVSRRRG